jgi:hypothetical protein
MAALLEDLNAVGGLTGFGILAIAVWCFLTRRLITHVELQERLAEREAQWTARFTEFEKREEIWRQREDALKNLATRGYESMTESINQLGEILRVQSRKE